MRIHWSLLPLTGLVCALAGMLATMMTQNIWSAHTSMTGRDVVERLGDKVSEDFATANQSFVEMKVICTALDDRLAGRRHWWQR